ncbi:P-loop NTPase fold protein [Hyphococcus lacteus]|uniref:P-loop NTPase fold protein n=1 Tax=Hyphococcus lacteus TaxID=3143536 RepID=A0ABV3Z5K8_9PROT
MTATNLVSKVIVEFLRTKTPEVLCISGNWGVGKTYLWNKILTEQLKDGNSGYNDHAYVSLFGCNSLEKLKLAIFENSEFLNGSDANPVVNVISDGSKSFLSSIQKSRNAAAEAPIIGAWIKAGSGLFFASVRNRIVCIDDFERRGENLRIIDVLGLASFLKEQRNCKVVLILNDERLSPDDKKNFEKHLEKVVDKKISFDPSLDDCHKIVFDNDGYLEKTLSELSKKLGIKNIRVLKKIKHFGSMLDNSVCATHEEIRYAALHSLCLFSWIELQPSIAPPIELVFKNRHPDHIEIMETLSSEEPSEKPDSNKLYDEILRDYGLTYIDELDEEILAGVKNGYFNHEKICKIVERDHSILKSKKLKDEFANAWRLFHDSYKNNLDEIVSRLTETTLNILDNISFRDLDSSIILLKSLKAEDEVKQIITRFKANRVGSYDYWYNANNEGYNVKDSDLKALMITNANESDNKPTPLDILLGQNEEYISEISAKALNELSVDKLKSLLIQLEGDKLRTAKQRLLFASTISNPKPHEKKLTETTIQALKEIGQENLINKVRIKYHHGIDVDIKT